MSQIIEWLKGASMIWVYELFEVGGAPFTVGKLITGLLLLGFGYWLAKRASDAIDRRLISRLEIESSLRQTLKRALFYFLVVIVTLFTLHTLSVPITIFAVLGGALAIGFGFGSQNVVNNFISGIIMMIEQPVRIGDFVEVDGLRGTIELIGIRSTHMLTPENRQVILPNSYFLEKAVMNWTLDSDVVRGKISVGVGYESDVEKVKDILEKVAINHEDVLPQPVPRVVFSDFGDNALLFDIYFWYRMGQRRMTAEIESDLRFVINHEFRKGNISIPFPQRQVHLTVPLQVEVKARSNL